jgi:flagellar protein FliS
VSNNQMQQRYLRDAVSTASPARLIVMLYDRLGLDLRRAVECFDADQRFDAAPHLIHGQQILAELMSSLRTDVWPEGEKLSSLYSYLLRELIATNGDGDASRLTAVTEIVTGLRNSWAEAAVAVQQSATVAITPEHVVAGNQPMPATAWVG